MEDWTQEEKNQIFESYWTNGSARCPSDQARLHIERAGHFQGYILLANCPRCGKQMQMSHEADPRRAQFRRWNEADLNTIVNNYFEHGSSACPSCAASLSLKPLPVQGRVVAIMCHCPRCGNDRTAKEPFAQA